MGCDIHAHVEIKVQGRWEHYSCPYIDRNYSLFCRMAGVRQYDGSPEPISQPRGLPDDISTVTRLDNDKWGCDGHSHSWLSAKEAGLIQEWLEKETKPKHWHPPVFGYLFGNYIHSYVDDPQEMKDKGFDDARLVFWFDN